MTLEELEIIISANNQKFNTQIAQVQSKVDNMTTRVNSSLNKMSGTFNKIGKMIAGAFAITAISRFTKECLDLGSDLQEVQNVVDVTFGSMSDKVNEFAQNAWKTVGLSETMAKQYMGNFGAMAKSMGFTVESAEKMAETLTNLSGDVASFYNITQDEAYTKLKSVFTGETETLKELGVVMTQENLNQYALANGYGKTTEKMNQQEKVALRLAYVTETLSAANGDFARTSNSWANQVRLLSLQFQSFKASIGQGLIAVLTPVINIINKIMAKLVQMANTFNSVLSAIGFNISSGSGGNSFFGESASGIDSSTDAMKELGSATDGVGSSADKAKKKVEALMGIDEINKVNSSSDSNSGSGSGSGIGSISSPAIDTSATENSLTALNEKINKILSELLSPLKKAWDNYGDWFLAKWDYFKRAFGYSCDELKNLLISVWNHGGKEFVQHMAEIGIAVGGVALQIGGNILVALGNLWRHINPDNNPYTRKFIDTMNSLAIAVRDFIISAGNWFSKFLDLGGQAFINVIGDIVILIGTILAEVVRDAIKFITAFMNSWVGSAIIGAVALTLDVVATAIKAVLIVIEKCHVVLEGFLVLWGAWKFNNIITGIGDTTTKLGGLLYKLYGLGVNLSDNITQFGEWIKTIGGKAFNTIKSFASYIGGTVVKNLKSFGKEAKNPISTFSNLTQAIKLNIIALKNQVKQLVISSIEWVKNTAKIISQKVAYVSVNASLIASVVATKAAAAAQVLLNVALNACPIVAIIGGIILLVAAVKKIGDKFGWWANISNALSSVLGWIGEKVGWLWDKVKSFFGWDSEPAVNDSIESIGDTAEEAAQTTDDAFGTATSNVNKYLDSIHFNATRLAEEVDEATKTATEKFNMLSKTAQEYLDTIVNNDSERLAEMSQNQATYNEEIKAMYADLTEAEKNEFMKRYGIIQGINDDMLNYEGLTYDERVARHAAYLETIQNNESVSYQEKKAMIDQANADFQSSIDQEVAKYQESITAKQEALDNLLATHGNTTGQGKAYEQELRDAIEADRKHIEEITKSSYDSQVTTAAEATEAIKNVNSENVTAQEEAYENLSATVDESMTKVNSSLKDAKKNIESFTKDSKSLSDKLKNSFEGVGDKISSEFTKASTSITKTINQIQSTVNNSTASIKSNISNSFINILQTVTNMLNNISSNFQSYSTKMTNINNNLVSTISNQYQTMNSQSQNYFNSMRNNSINAMNDVYRNVSNQLQNIKSLFNNFNATLKVKVPHFYMTGEFNAETKQVPKVGVHYFARDGVVDRATLGVFGEAGKEALVPLENNTEWMDTVRGLISSGFAQAMQFSSISANDSSDKPINFTIQVGTTTLGKIVIDSINKVQRQAGTTLLRI
ncbi:MAG: Phage-related protein [uncultured Clostridium sp.]